MRIYIVLSYELLSHGCGEPLIEFVSTNYEDVRNVLPPQAVGYEQLPQKAPDMKRSGECIEVLYHRDQADQPMVCYEVYHCDV